MSRQIKFRAWNGEQMISPDYITRNGVGYWKEDSIPCYSEELMQFTGIIDKDDVDIYEGDKCLKDGDTTVYIVSWNQQQGQYWLMPLNDGVFDFPYQLSNGYLKLIKIKVIGNIHENKK